MRRTAAILFLIALGGTASAGPSDEERLGRGEVLVEQQDADGLPQTTLRAVIDAPPVEVWKIVKDCGRYRETMERIRASRMELLADGRVRCTVTIAMPFPYSDMTATSVAVHSVEGDGFARRWTMESGDYKVNQGSWELRPFRGDARRTAVVYRVVAVPKTYIPNWMREAGQRRSLPAMIEKIRRQVAKPAPAPAAPSPPDLGRR